MEKMQYIANRVSVRCRMLQRAILAAAAIAVLALPASSFATHAPPGTKVWGYEAAGGNARILQYDIGTDTFDTSCVPDTTANGRGIAFDPVDGNLWYTRVGSGFTGDGLIHKSTLPPVCAAFPPIPFDDGPGGTTQDGIGALDVDPDDADIWAAGYQPIGTNSFLYKVSRSTGALIQSCFVPFGGGGVGNDTLTEAKLSGLPGSGSYLLTDAGELFTAPNDILAVDEASCTGGGPGTISASFSKSVLMSGIDFELSSLIATDLANIYNLGGPPFSPPLATMSTAPSGLVEDLTLKAQLVSTGPCKVTYGGRIKAANGDKATFGGNARTPANGQEEYQDHGPAAPLNVHSINVQSVTCSPDKTQATIKGQATINGSGSFNYQIDLQDLGEPGTSDTYRIQVSSYDSGTQTLVGGNVQIH